MVIEKAELNIGDIVDYSGHITNHNKPIKGVKLLDVDTTHTIFAQSVAKISGVHFWVCLSELSPSEGR